MSKNILISGGNGFLGSKVYEHLKSFYNIKKISLRPNFDSEDYLKKYLGKFKPDFFFHFAYTKKNFDRNYNYLNYKLPLIISRILNENKNDAKFIYISTNNVLLKKTYDRYTLSKKIIEESIQALPNVVIMRFPLVIANELKGDKKKLSKIVNFFPLFSIIPKQGSRINYIGIEELLDGCEILLRDKTLKYLNIKSNKYKYLQQLAEEVSKKYKIYVNIKFLSFFLRRISPALSFINYEKELEDLKY